MGRRRGRNRRPSWGGPSSLNDWQHWLGLSHHSFEHIMGLLLIVTRRKKSRMGESTSYIPKNLTLALMLYQAERESIDDRLALELIIQGSPHCIDAEYDFQAIQRRRRLEAVGGAAGQL